MRFELDARLTVQLSSRACTHALVSVFCVLAELRAHSIYLYDTRRTRPMAMPRSPMAMGPMKDRPLTCGHYWRTQQPPPPLLLRCSFFNSLTISFIPFCTYSKATFCCANASAVEHNGEPPSDST